ncbi:urease accessory protein UreD [Hansschlegelia plantiphila]|uniref:Urease accessory protein UreD n=1 Tax=Hansschlegelia plantiphila TaxID=374655 RepID=A0A9W6J2F6_9HYPH|nr:urease accessory protein UreD [Hansschlegelia plantiphila]GLK68069.1 urease accessory protein UreD [Hansschlegelia plantiphila]
MYASDSPSEILGGVPAPPRQRSEGSIALRVETSGGGSRVTRLAEGGASRIRIPRAEHGLDAVMLNVAGGLACGDRMTVSVEAGPDSAVALSTPGAERVYRSDGATTHVETRLSVEAGATLGWLPQETILFDRSRLSRRLDADVASDGRLLVYEALVFGRVARGETVEGGMLDDRWRVRRGGGLVFAETLSFVGPIREILAKRTVAAGSVALATLLYVAPDAEARLAAVREALEHHAVEAGASAWNGMLVLRLLSPFGERLRDAAHAVLPLLLARPLPRVWSC